MIARYHLAILVTSVLLLSGSWSTRGQGQQDDVLWYAQPAKDWNEALPVGNGALGAMVFGGVETERLQLNEKTVWAGGREEFSNPKARASLGKVRSLLFQSRYADAQKLAQETLMGNKKRMSAYQTLGDLTMHFYHPSSEIRDYRRSLDIGSAVASVSYTAGGVRYSRSVIASAPDNVIAIRIESTRPGTVSMDVALSRAGNKAAIRYDGSEARMQEHINGGDGVTLSAMLRVIAKGGKVSSSETGIVIRDADDVTILLTAATDFFQADPIAESEKRLAAATARGYTNILNDHTADYRRFFDRVKIDLSQSNASYFPTDLRLQALRDGNTDPGLIELYYQFGRYLLISSSRPGTLPANLQGLWADGLNPPWDADYHININIQMNYWPAEMTNLSELHEPFFQFLDSLRRDGRKTAREMYDSRGVVAHFTTDAWFFTEPYGQTQWAMWPMGYAWSVAHLWERYLFREDRKFLETTAYPMMKDAATFCLDWLVKDPRTGKLVSGPSISPENTFRTKHGEVATMVMGPTMDHMIIRQLFRNTITAATILQRDAAFRKQLEKALAYLAPTKITSDGRIMEWTEEFAEPEPGHRHISHLYGLHPGNEIARDGDTTLLAAARNTIRYRLANGGGHTGWSRAWIINFYARLGDEAESYSNLVEFLRKSTLPNLFDNHPPFQIDGNFGAVAGITEMLLQSHGAAIDILPALPREWSSGSISGLCARGGFDVSLSWKECMPERVEVTSRNGNKCTLRLNGRVHTFDTTPGSVYVFNGELQPVTN